MTFNGTSDNLRDVVTQVLGTLTGSRTHRSLHFTSNDGAIDVLLAFD